VVRSPEKITIKHDNLEVVKGDACDVESFASVMEGKDAVLSSLGSSTYVSVFSSTTFYSESIKAITEAMKRHKITRLIAVTSWCTQPGPNNRWYVEWIVKPFFIGAYLKDMAIMEKFLEQSNPEEINYTIVRPPQLKNGEPTGVYKIEEGQCNAGEAAGWIYRADVAHFMLSCLETNEYDRKGMAITY